MPPVERDLLPFFIERRRHHIVYREGPAVPEPAWECGPDLTEDELDCAVYMTCR